MSDAAAGGTARGWYRHYVLFVLMLVYVANFIDRQVLSILLEPIKREFGVSDSVLGLLAGPTFAIFYATIGLPLAYAADRMNRRNIIAASLAVFSVMTALCGLAAQFWQLALARIGVGIGEAGTSPQSHSMIADLYRPDERVGALTVLGIAPFIGIAIALLAGGWISQHYGWRTAFLIAGLPGVALALLVVLTIGEPARGASENLAAAHPPRIGETLRFLWRQKS
jgi:predicted MFS family arabinose efflux permease